MCGTPGRWRPDSPAVAPNRHGTPPRLRQLPAAVQRPGHRRPAQPGRHGHPGARPGARRVRNRGACPRLHSDRARPGQRQALPDHRALGRAPARKRGKAAAPRAPGTHPAHRPVHSARQRRAGRGTGSAGRQAARMGCGDGRLLHPVQRRPALLRHRQRPGLSATDQPIRPARAADGGRPGDPLRRGARRQHRRTPNRGLSRHLGRVPRHRVPVPDLAGAAQVPGVGPAHLLVRRRIVRRLSGTAALPVGNLCPGAARTGPQPPGDADGGRILRRGQCRGSSRRQGTVPPY